jgi:hypothetical protein
MKIHYGSEIINEPSAGVPPQDHQTKRGSSPGEQREDSTTRRDFLQKVALNSVGLALASKSANAFGAQEAKPVGLPAGKPLKVFCYDLNWVLLKKPVEEFVPASAEDWAFISPQEYFDWHKDLGVNIMFCQASTLEDMPTTRRNLDP